MSHFWGHRPGWPFPPGASASALMARRATHLNRQRYPGPGGEEQLLALCEPDNSTTAPGMVLGSGFWVHQAGTLEVRANPAGYTVGGTVAGGGVELRYTIPNPYTLSGYPVSCIFTMWEVTTSTGNVFVGGYRSPATNTESLSVGVSSGNAEGMIFRYGGSQQNDSGGAQMRVGLLNTWTFVSYAADDHMMFSAGRQSNAQTGTSRDYMGGDGNDGIWILDNPDAFEDWNATQTRSLLAATWIPREVTREEIAQLDTNPWAPYMPNNLMRDFGAMTGPAASGTVPFLFPMRGLAVS